MRKEILLFKMAAILALGIFSTSAIAKSFTLSDDDLMLLDWHSDGCSKSKVINKIDVEGPGVEFDIYFPDADRSNHSVTYVSCRNGGKGLLTGIDISDYNAFALKFTLVSVNDSNSPDAGGSLVVGALVDMGYSYGYRPEVISLQPQHSNTAISSTKTDAKDISIIGFTVHFLTPDGWDPNGSTIRLLIEPAPNAEILPQS
jgi:hypothetical protein